jgi:hypothetical protein
MSGSTYIVAQPVRLDTFRAGEVDERAIDFAPDLTPYGDLLESIISIEVIKRDDGHNLSPADLHVITGDTDRQLTIDPSGYIIGWWQTSTDSIASNGITVDYTLTVRAFTQAGRTIICDAMQLLVPLRG